MISIVIDPDLRYPDADEHFSPDERFPEYRFEHVAQRPNPVYRAVRDVFIQAGLDRERLGTPEWNPLGEYIKPGSRVFLLANFMQEQRADESDEDFWSRCSHARRAPAAGRLHPARRRRRGQREHRQRGRSSSATGTRCCATRTRASCSTSTSASARRSRSGPAPAGEGRHARSAPIRGVERRDEADGVHVRLDGDSLFAELDDRTRATA